jgi:hypothetical protein
MSCASRRVSVRFILGCGSSSENASISGLRPNFLARPQMVGHRRLACVGLVQWHGTARSGPAPDACRYRRQRRAPLAQAGLREAVSKIEAIASFLRPHFGHPFEPYIPHRVLPRSAHWTKWLGSVTGCGHRRDRKCRGTPKRAGGMIVHSAGAAR